MRRTCHGVLLILHSYYMSWSPTRVSGVGRSSRYSPRVSLYARQPTLICSYESVWHFFFGGLVCVCVFFCLGGGEGEVGGACVLVLVLN